MLGSTRRLKGLLITLYEIVRISLTKKARSLVESEGVNHVAL